MKDEEILTVLKKSFINIEWRLERSNFNRELKIAGRYRDFTSAHTIPAAVACERSLQQSAYCVVLLIVELIRGEAMEGGLL